MKENPEDIYMHTNLFKVKKIISKNIENNISQISFSKNHVYFFDKERVRIKKS